MRFALAAWVARRLFRLARTPGGRKLLLLAWGAAMRSRRRKNSRRTVVSGLRLR